MLWFTIHNILKNCNIENKKRNLTTFFAGILLYIVFYSYVDSFGFIDHPRLFGHFFCIAMADIIAISTYKETNFTEAKETMSLSGPKINDTEYNANISNQHTTDHNTSIRLLKNDSDYIDEIEGFTKDSALGNAYSTNGVSNI
jgi:hypothetical protein